MRIGDIARALGVSRDTIRRLERRGLITAERDWAGHRRFSPTDLERVRTFLFKKENGTGGTQQPLTDTP